MDGKRLRVVIMPLEADRPMMEVGEDEDIVVTLIGQKAWLLDLISGLAALSPEEPADSAI